MSLFVCFLLLAWTRQRFAKNNKTQCNCVAKTKTVVVSKIDEFCQLRGMVTYFQVCSKVVVLKVKQLGWLLEQRDNLENTVTGSFYEYNGEH